MMILSERVANVRVVKLCRSSRLCISKPPEGPGDELGGPSLRKSHSTLCLIQLPHAGLDSSH